MLDNQQQTPFTTNQVESNKPTVPKTVNILSGWNANSMNGGHNRTIAFKKVMAGEKHREMTWSGNIKLLTPKTPTYQNLRATIRTYFVPNSRVWENAEKYTAQKGGSTDNKIKIIPNLGAHGIPKIGLDNNTNLTVLLTNTDIWRNCFMSCYIPRISSNEATLNTGATFYYPAVSVLPLRGRVAIMNDFENNKEYDGQILEFKGDTVSVAEMQNYQPFATNIDLKTDYYNCRAKKDNSYWSNYRTELQGFQEEQPNGEQINDDLLNWAAWMSKIAESRSQAELAQANDWDIIAKIRGSKKLTEGKVQLLGTRTFNLNYATVTQSTYNTNENISEEFQVMGQQGAYSYTEIKNLPLYSGFEAVEEGYIHVIMTVSADEVYESGIDRNELNITPLDEYRPDLINDKKDVLYEIEMGTHHIDGTNRESYSRAVGFKRRFSEYFKLPNCIGGDMTTENYWVFKNGTVLHDAQIITQKTYQFFEVSPTYFKNGEEIIPKKIWKDYTDLHLNKNQCIMNGIERKDETTNEFYLKGNHQIFFVGMCNLVAELPIDGSISENYTKWGEE